MKHNAHYSTKFNGVKIPCSVLLVDSRNEDAIKTFEEGSDFGDVMCELYRHVKYHTVAVCTSASRMTIFGFTPLRRDFIRLCTSVRDFLTAEQDANRAEV